MDSDKQIHLDVDAIVSFDDRSRQSVGGTPISVSRRVNYASGN